MTYRQEENVKREVEQVRDRDVGLHRARVTQVPADGNHVVKISPIAVDAGDIVQGGTPKDAIVPVDTYGDVSLPSEGDLAIVEKTQNDLFVVRGVLYTRQDAGPSYQEGERRVGHSETGSHFRIDPDGVITIEADDGTTFTVDPSDGTVRVNGGSTGVVTDVTTTTDTDGHVTSVDVVRSNYLYVP